VLLLIHIGAFDNTSPTQPKAVDLIKVPLPEEQTKSAIPSLSQSRENVTIDSAGPHQPSGRAHGEVISVTAPVVSIWIVAGNPFTSFLLALNTIVVSGTHSGITLAITREGRSMSICWAVPLIVHIPLIRSDDGISKEFL